MTRAKALYQVKLILDYLPKEEYALIPKETIDYIEDNFEYDENFSLNPELPLDEQNIDDKAYDFLEKIVKQAERVEKKLHEEELKPYLKSVESFSKEFESNMEMAIRNKDEELKAYIEQIKKSNEDYETKIENIRLKNIIQILKKEAEKLPEAKKICEIYKVEYKKIENEKNEEIANLTRKIDELEEKLNKIPNFIRKIFVSNNLLKKS